MGYLSWVKTMLASPSWRRTDWRKELIEALKTYRKPRKTPQTKFISEILESGEAEFVGFTPMVQYIKEVPDPEIPGDEQAQLGCIWDHPHANPAMLFWIKDLGVFITVGPGLRFNHSILNEVGMTHVKSKGING